jgi:hypothetical protein
MPTLDDASFHSDADDFPPDVPKENGATHIGMFLRWTIDNGLFDQPMIPEEAVEAVRNRTMSGRNFLLDHCDGTLFPQLFNDAGADFATKHYQGFLEDFERLLCPGLRSGYEVEDNEENYRTMAAALDARWAQHRQDEHRRDERLPK